MSWWNRSTVMPATPLPRVVGLDSPEIEDPKSTPGYSLGPPRRIENSAKPVELPKDPDPEPDLSTKPKDIVGYCFGYVCPKKHIGGKFEEITVDGYKERRLCQECGAISQPAVIKQSAAPIWKDCGSYTGGAFRYYDGPRVADWKWTYNYTYKQTMVQNMSMSSQDHPVWEKFEFVHYLDTPRKKKK